jgi:hypothetical protein
MHNNPPKQTGASPYFGNRLKKMSFDFLMAGTVSHRHSIYASTSRATLPLSEWGRCPNAIEISQSGDSGKPLIF